MSRGFIVAKPSQIEGVNFPKEVLLGVLQDSLILKAALETVHAAVQTGTKNQKASAWAAITSALKRNPNLEVDDLTPVAVEVFKCPKSEEQKMLQILGDLHKPERFGAVLSQLRQLFEVRSQEENVIALPARCYRDESAWSSTAATTAAADRTCSSDDGRSTFSATPAPVHEDLINWMCSSVTGTRPPGDSIRVDSPKASLSCRDAWWCAILARNFDRRRNRKAEGNEFERIGPTDEARNVILKYLKEGFSKAFRAGRGVSDAFCDHDPEVWSSAARVWAGEEASALANKLFREVDKVRVQVVLPNDKSGHATLRIIWKDLPHESEHVDLTAVIRKCFIDHVNKRIGLFRLDLACDYVEGVDGQIVRYDFFRRSVYEFCGILLPDSGECRRAFKDSLGINRGFPSTPGEFECNVVNHRLNKVVQTYVKEVLDLEVARPAFRQLDEGTAISIAFYCDKPSAAAVNYSDPPATRYRDMSAWKTTAAPTDQPDGGRSTIPATPAPKYEKLINWICSNVIGTRPFEELKPADCAEASLHCRDAWLCAELERRFDHIRDGNAGWNEFEQIGFRFTDRAKYVILKYLEGGSSRAFQAAKDFSDQFCDVNPELWKSAARDWAVEEASAFAHKLVSRVEKVRGQVVPLNDKSGHATLRIIFEVLPHESEHVDLTAVIRKCFTDHVNKRLGLYRLHLACKNVEGFNGPKMKYDVFRESVRQSFGISLPIFYDCRRAFRDKLVIDRGHPSNPGKFDCKVDKSRLIEVVKTHVQEVFGLEVAKPASRHFDIDTAISKSSYCNDPSAAAANKTDSPASSHSGLSAL